jgi:hypothetical protein
MAKIIGAELFKENLFGFFSIDFISHSDPFNKNENLIYLLGLDCFINN